MVSATVRESDESVKIPTRDDEGGTTMAIARDEKRPKHGLAEPRAEHTVGKRTSSTTGCTVVGLSAWRRDLAEALRVSRGRKFRASGTRRRTDRTWTIVRCSRLERRGRSRRERDLVLARGELAVRRR